MDLNDIKIWSVIIKDHYTKAVAYQEMETLISQDYLRSVSQALDAAIQEIEEMQDFIVTDHALDLDCIPKKWGGERD